MEGNDDTCRPDYAGLTYGFRGSIETVFYAAFPGGYDDRGYISMKRNSFMIWLVGTTLGCVTAFFVWIGGQALFGKWTGDWRRDLINTICFSFMWSSGIALSLRLWKKK